MCCLSLCGVNILHEHATGLDSLLAFPESHARLLQLSVWGLFLVLSLSFSGEEALHPSLSFSVLSSEPIRPKYSELQRQLSPSLFH